MAEMLNMDLGWKFHRGDIEKNNENSHSASYFSVKAGSMPGPGGKIYDDSQWRIVDVPHDYFAESGFDAENLLSHGYRERCNAWYRKTFLLPDTLQGKHLRLCFEGTAVNAEFYLNGSLMAHSFSAYTETEFDITDRVYFGEKPNVLAVYINGMTEEGWWYEGAGIYRHVRLYVSEPVHIAHNGIFAKPVWNDGKWRVDVRTTVENALPTEHTVSVRATLFDGEKPVGFGSTCPNAIPFSDTADVTLSFPVETPHLWDVDDPYLYEILVELLDGDTVLETEKRRIGFRTFYMDAEKGFFLNGRSMKLKGTCNHQDHAGVGVAVPDRVQHWRIEKLKEMGANAYRCAHNVPAPEILNACDELGILVMDENRRFETRKEVLEAVDAMVRRDCNHPSVIMYSLFNEEPLQNTEEGARIYRTLKRRVLRLDDSRILTGAINGTMEGAGMEMDASGVNYGIPNVPALHALHPTQPMFGSENASALSVRGCWKTDQEAHVLAGYDEERPDWGQTIRETWDMVRKHAYFAGAFLWTGFDYRGEPTPFRWPTVSSLFGLMDTCGNPKGGYYFARACYVTEPTLKLLCHWNHTPGESVRVMAVSNCEAVELFVNGRSMGRKPDDLCAHSEWCVPFQPGQISAVGYIGGEKAAEDTVYTAGKAKKLELKTSSLTAFDDGQDTVILNIAVTDEDGNVVPGADALIHLEAEGGVLLGVGNGNPNSHESDAVPYRHAFEGRMQAIFRVLPGAKNVTVRATSEGLEDGNAVVSVVPGEKKDFIRSCENTILEGWRLSPAFPERPDPNMEIADNDMNSFIPVELDGPEFLSDVVGSWRMLRTETVLPSGTGKYILQLGNIRAETMEIWVAGRCIFRESAADDLLSEGRIAAFTGKPGEKAEIRILFYAPEGTLYGAGIRGSVRLAAEKGE